MQQINSKITYLNPTYLQNIPTEDYFQLHNLSQSCSDWPGRKEIGGITAFKIR